MTRWSPVSPPGKSLHLGVVLGIIQHVNISLKSGCWAAIPVLPSTDSASHWSSWQDSACQLKEGISKAFRKRLCILVRSGPKEPTGIVQYPGAGWGPDASNWWNGRGQEQWLVSYCYYVDCRCGFHVIISPLLYIHLQRNPFWKERKEKRVLEEGKKEERREEGRIDGLSLGFSRFDSSPALLLH